MKLELTTKELRKLIELAYLGEWMINAQHDPQHQDEPATEILQRLLAAYRSSSVGKDAETGENYMKLAWTESLYDRYVFDYDDHVFWDELTERLAQRDLAKARGVSVDEINRDDDLFELRPLEERYRSEMERHGIERLDITGEY